MAYIYQIVNDVNQKVYVGKTDFSIEKRFKEHRNDAFKERSEKRPLYSAMQKYGIEHFHIEPLEETDNPDERERYWIEQKGSFKWGYNATVGGDGKHYADYDLIYSLWDSEQLNEKQISNITGYDQKTIKRALMKNKITDSEIRGRADKAKHKSVARLDPKTGEILEVFASMLEADRKYSANHHITDVCRGKRKTAGGFGWKFLN